MAGPGVVADGAAAVGHDLELLRRLEGSVEIAPFDDPEYLVVVGVVLDALLRGGYWVDAAYVAERVLTTGGKPVGSTPITDVKRSTS